MAPFFHRHQQEQPFVYSSPSALPVLFSADSNIGLILILFLVLVRKSILTDGCLQQISLKKSPSKPTHANLNTDHSNSNHIYFLTWSWFKKACCVVQRTTKMSTQARGILQLKFLIVANLFRMSATLNTAHVHLLTTEKVVCDDWRKDPVIFSKGKKCFKHLRYGFLHTC